jgi:hypothetical protein
MANHIIRDREESPVQAIVAFDPRLLADSKRPFVGTRRTVPRSARLSALESSRVDIISSPKQRSEIRDFRTGGRTGVHLIEAHHHRLSAWRI